MPIFDYRCERCGHRFDHFFRSQEEEERLKMVCPRCGSERLRKLISIFGTGRASDAGCSSGPSKSG